MTENINKKLSKSRNEEIRELFVQIHENYIVSNTSSENVANSVIDPALLNILSLNDNSVKLVFDQANFQIIKVSKNFEEVTGLKEEDIENLGNILRHVTPDCLKFLLKTAEYHIVSLTDSISKNHNSFQITLCGLSVVDKNGRTNRLLVHYTPYKFDEMGHAQLVIITLFKINFMLKSDTMWARLAHGEDEQEITHISNEDLEYKHKDILSEREIEILKCIDEGMDADEIAKTLFISLHTLKNHRKNMLARTGLCDTTALIQICRTCGILK